MQLHFLHRNRKSKTSRAKLVAKATPGLLFEQKSWAKRTDRWIVYCSSPYQHSLIIGVAGIYSQFQQGCLEFQYGVSRCRCLNVPCTFLKHNYHFGMTRVDYISRFQNHIKIDERNQIAYTEAAITQHSAVNVCSYLTRCYMQVKI